MATCSIPLCRIGWFIADPVTLVKEAGDRLVLTERATSVVLLDVKVGSLRALEREVACKSRDPLTQPQICIH